MGKMIYLAIASLDGYIEDEHGNFDWAMPSDELHLFVTPIVVGGGKQALPSNVRLDLELLDERRFGNGMVFLNYRIRE